MPLRRLFATDSDPIDASTPQSWSQLRLLHRDGSQMNLGFSCSLFQLGSRQFLVLGLRPRPADDAPGLRSQEMRALGRMAGAVAHDFNNLLTGILLYCDLLLAGLDTRDALRAYVQEIRSAGGHSAELVQQLMAVARPQKDTAAHSWGEVVSGTRHLLLRLLGENIELEMNHLPLNDLRRNDLGTNDLGTNDPRRNELRLDLAASEMRVAVPAAEMRQILLNLLLNARDAMPGGGHIALLVAECPACAHPCVALAVQDSGRGMDEETRSRLFENFFTTKRPGEGTGMGLATVQRIVQQHGGTIAVESQPGRGTRMSVHLPRVSRSDEIIPITPERKDR
jgi:two-component system, cell cycle sensor histidine kinase and response regulator CckA